MTHVSFSGSFRRLVARVAVKGAGREWARMRVADVLRVGGLCAVLAGAVVARPAVAEPVAVSVTAVLPDGGEARPVSWAAVPLDLPPSADVLDAMVMTPSPVDGPWQVALEPGAYVISGFTEHDLFEARVTVTAQSAVIEVPLLWIEQRVALRCDEAAGCDFSDADTGLSLTVPQGWAVEVPYFADLGDGEVADQVSTVLFEDIEGDGAAVWFLNPEEWIDDDNGPCRPVAVGVMCTFDVSAAAQAAFAVIAPSLARAE